MNGNFVINEIQVSIAPSASPGQPTLVALKNPQADFSQEGWPAANAIDGNDGTGWAISPSFNVPHFASFETATDAGAAGGSIVTIRLSQQFNDGTHALGRFRISLTDSPRPHGRSNLPEAVLAALQVDADQRNAEQKQVLANHFRAMDSDYQSLLASVQRSTEAIKNRRLLGVQDLAWALINNPAFLFNR
jgi:hypothetical protein